MPTVFTAITRTNSLLGEARILMLKHPSSYAGKPENNDQWIHQVVFPFKKRGFYVELGAADGVTGSSCNVLEQIGWRGICVEPCSAFFPSLCRNRPKALCENICVGERSGQVRFREDSYLSRIVRQPKYEFHRHDRFVPCLTLVDLLVKQGAPPVIDYLAMDCEGSDGWILNAFDFNAYQILAISMEGDEAGPTLTANGFIKVRNPFNDRCPWEKHYVHESLDSSALERIGTASD